ncbi:hypothetical protein ACLB1E_19745 [Escherichia coli]
MVQQRIDNGDMQQTVFGILGINEEGTAREIRLPADVLKDGTAARRSGIRLLPATMLLTGTDNIRDVIAFPKTTAAACLMVPKHRALLTRLHWLS